jgi:hypothetical protein
MMRLVVGCDGQIAVQRVLEALSRGELTEKNYLTFIKQHEFGCAECRRLGRLKSAKKRFTNPRWAHTADETLTIDFVCRAVEIARSVKVPAKIKNQLLKNEWAIVTFSLPSTNKQAEKKSSRAPLDSWN